MNAEVTPLFRWEVVKFPWGTAVREQRTKKWHNLFLSPDGQEINVESVSILLHDNGIEFI
jgi:hypothetical protein